MITTILVFLGILVLMAVLVVIIVGGFVHYKGLLMHRGESGEWLVTHKSQIKEDDR